MKIRKGDRVKVLAGKDRGKTGTITFAYPAKGKVVVDGMNIAKKHQKATGATMQESSTKRCRCRYRTSRSSVRRAESQLVLAIASNLMAPRCGFAANVKVTSHEYSNEGVSSPQAAVQR